MPWTRQPTPPEDLTPTPISTCCLPCATELAKTPSLECTRPHFSQPCLGCTLNKEPCKPIPTFLQPRIAELRAISNSEERQKAVAGFAAEAASWEGYCRTPEEDGNRLLKSLNRNVFRLVQLKRMEMGLGPLGEEEEEVPRVLGGLV